MALKPKQAEPERLDAEDEDAAAAPPRKFTPTLIAIIAVGAVLALAGAGTAGYFLFSGSKEPKVAATPAARLPTFMDLPEVLVNLSNVGSDRTQYLKVRVVLEIPDAALQQQIQMSMPRVMDAFQTYLRELRPSDLDGSAGLYRLKEELTRRVNAAVSPNRVNAVLFKEIVVQ